MPIRTIIIDDEKLAREGIKLRLNENNDFKIIDECCDGATAISSIRKNKPDLVFLDVQMPEINGFRVLENISTEDFPMIVFITAFDKYAIDAFEVNALDYLLKPIDDDRFAETLERVRHNYLQKQSCSFADKIKNLINDYPIVPETSKNSSASVGMEKILIKNGAKIYFVDTNNIIWIEAADDYLFIHTENKKHILRKRLKDFLTELPEDTFLQIHRSAIINKNFVREIMRTGTNREYLILTTNEKLKISKTHRKDLFASLKNK